MNIQDLELDENPPFTDNLENENDDNYVVNSPKSKKSDNLQEFEEDIINHQLKNHEQEMELQEKSKDTNEQIQQQQNNQQIDKQKRKHSKARRTANRRNNKSDNKSTSSPEQQKNGTKKESEDLEGEQEEGDTEEIKFECQNDNSSNNSKKQSSSQVRQDDEQQSKSYSSSYDNEFSEGTSIEFDTQSERERKQHFDKNKDKFSIINDQKLKENTEQFPADKNKDKKITDYILTDFQEVIVTYKKELEKFRKQSTLGEGDLRYEKKNVANFQGENVLKVTKEPKHTNGLIEFFTNQCTRYIFFDKHLMYVLEKKKGNQYKVKSITKLEGLMKIFVERNTKNLTMAFTNEKRDFRIPPKLKKFIVSDVHVFLSLLKAEITTLGFDLTYK